MSSNLTSASPRPTTASPCSIMKLVAGAPSSFSTESRGREMRARAPVPAPVSAPGARPQHPPPDAAAAPRAEEVDADLIRRPARLTARGLSRRIDARAAVGAGGAGAGRAHERREQGMRGEYRAGGRVWARQTGNAVIGTRLSVTTVHRSPVASYFPPMRIR